MAAYVPENVSSTHVCVNNILLEKRTATAVSIATNEKIAEIVKKKTPFYISRNYAFLWGGQAISNLGDLIFDTTLTLWIATGIARGQSWAPIAMGGAVLCISIPTFLVGPLAGVFVDRWDKRRTMIWMDTIRAICIALLLLMALPLPFLASHQLPAIAQLVAVYVVLLFTTICSLFFGPARLSIVKDVVDEKNLERASGLGMLTQNISRIVGPSLAAPTLFVFGVQWALLIDVASFLVSAFAIRFVQITEQSMPSKGGDPKTGFWREFKAGLSFFAQNRVLLIILVALTLVITGDSAEQTLGVFFMLDNLHVPTYLYGFIGTVGGIGGILGALASVYIVERIGTKRAFWMGITGFGLLLFLFSRMTLFGPALVLIFLAGLPTTAVSVALGPLLLRSIPRDLLGRVNAVFGTCLSGVAILAVSVISALASLLQNFQASFLGLRFGPYDTIFSVSGLLTISIGIGVAISLRNVSLAPQTNQEDVNEEKEEL
jgi:MFS family permease